MESILATGEIVGIRVAFPKEVESNFFFLDIKLIGVSADVLGGMSIPHRQDET